MGNREGLHIVPGFLNLLRDFLQTSLALLDLCFVVFDSEFGNVLVVLQRFGTAVFSDHPPFSLKKNAGVKIILLKTTCNTRILQKNGLKTSNTVHDDCCYSLWALC